jgi:hypothetical protein
MVSIHLLYSILATEKASNREDRKKETPHTTDYGEERNRTLKTVLPPPKTKGR